MAFCNVVVQGIEFQNLTVTDSLMLMVETEPGIGIAKPKIEETEKGIEHTEGGEGNLEVRKKNSSLVGALIHGLTGWLNRRIVSTVPTTPPPDNNDIAEAENVNIEGKSRFSIHIA
jgi:hypothetical protein